MRRAGKNIPKKKVSLLDILMDIDRARGRALCNYCEKEFKYRPGLWDGELQDHLQVHRDIIDRLLEKGNKYDFVDYPEILKRLEKIEEGKMDLSEDCKEEVCKSKKDKKKPLAKGPIRIRPPVRAIENMGDGPENNRAANVMVVRARGHREDDNWDQQLMGEFFGLNVFNDDFPGLVFPAFDEELSDSAEGSDISDDSNDSHSSSDSFSSRRPDGAEPPKALRKKFREMEATYAAAKAKKRKGSKEKEKGGCEKNKKGCCPVQKMYNDDLNAEYNENNSFLLSPLQEEPGPAMSENWLTSDSDYDQYQNFKKSPFLFPDINNNFLYPINSPASEFAPIEKITG